MERWKCLTGAGSRSQRGLESPGAEVWHCSLKDEGDRQGDKHGPLSTWGSLWFYFSFTFLPFSSAVLWSFFMLLPVCGKPRVNLEWFEMTLGIFLFVFYRIETLPLQVRLLVFTISEALGYSQVTRFSCLCWTQRCAGRAAATYGALAENIKLPEVPHTG